MESKTLNERKTMTHKLIVDCSTGVTTEVELTAEEIAQREADAVAFAEIKAAEEAAAQAKADAKASAQAKLSALGLTPDEIAALN
jgi:membrane protein involved in colicin uptake